MELRQLLHFAAVAEEENFTAELSVQTSLERRIAFEVSDLNTLLDLVACGSGIALVPEAIALARRDSIARVPLKDVEICWELVVERIVGVTPGQFRVSARIA